MVLGGASQKIQTIVELAEDLYERVTELREQLAATRETLDGVADQVDAVDRELTDQRALVEALCEEQGIDVDDVLAEVRDGESDAPEDA